MKTSEKEWIKYLKNKALWSYPLTDTIVLSPHPDDETLGAGGLISDLKEKKIDVLVISVTDGEKAYLNEEHKLRQIRINEQEKALEILGISKEKIIRLQLRDSAVKEEEEKLEKLIFPFVSKKMHLLAPWLGDYHPDHEAVGRAALKLARQKNAHLSFYFFWTWHYATILDLNQLPLYIYPLKSNAFINKQKALECYVSQRFTKKERPILPEHILIPTKRTFEVYYTYEY
ncbi:MAG: PIG-L family deacetylase [Legionella longbeachae]|nr:PIG-L family deacetylase [Legionella longbeachae]